MLWLLAQIPITIPDNANEIVATVKANPVLLAILIGVGVLTAILFVWGIMKSAIKSVIFGGLLSVGAWIWYFNIR